MKMPSFLLLLAVCSMGLGTATASDLDPDEKAFLMSISMGRGLYYNYPYVVNLNATNFDTLAKGKDYSWVIEFYNSWCGHCLRFTPTYKRLSNDIKDWSSIVKLGAVDCSNPVNLPICRYYNIVVTPTLKYFKPNIVTEEGITIPKYLNQTDKMTSKSTVEELRNNITQELMKRNDLLNLKQYSSAPQQLWDYAKAQSLYLVLVVECIPKVGPQLVLDYWEVKTVTVIPMNCNHNLMKKRKQLIKDMVKKIIHKIEQQLNLRLIRKYRVEYAIGRNVFVISKGKIKRTYEYKNLPHSNRKARKVLKRAYLLRKLHHFFSGKGIAVPKPFNMSSIKDVTDSLRQAFNNKEGGKRPYKHTDSVFRVDIEGALSQTLTVEIPMHKHINGNRLTALINYLFVLYKYFPIGKRGKEFLKCIIHRVRRVDSESGMAGQAFASDTDQCQKEHDPGYLEPNNGWVGCHGTFPMYRGFPCALWTMFHTLVVQAYDKRAKNPQEVLSAMKGYIRYFFGCTDCSQHFLGMAKNMKREVTTLESSVLWLWSAHNNANKRLHGDATEDPNFPKVQFPTEQVCRFCHFANGSFNEPAVLDFLHKMYTDIKQVTPTQIGFNTTYTGNSFYKPNLVSG